MTGSILVDAAFAVDDDPLDDISVDAPGLGILVRTDFSDDGAWREFCAKIKEAEAEYLQEPGSSTGDVAMDEDRDPENDGEGKDADEDDEDTPASIIDIFDPPPSLRARFTNISNLTALRLLNDADVRLLPKHDNRSKPAIPRNPLVDFDGWQEVYTGKLLWIYDAKSNEDKCVRLVSQQSAALPGTAT